MEVHQQLEQILTQINKELPPKDRVSEKEITSVGAQLNTMLHEATQETANRFALTAQPRSLRERLAALWQAIKERISLWLSPLPPRWKKFLEAVKAHVTDLQSKPGGEKLVGIAMLAIAVALVAVLVKSIPLLIALLAIVGFTTMLRMFERLTRIPQLP